MKSKPMKMFRYAVAPLLAAVMLMLPFSGLNTALAGRSYTISVGETVDMSFFYPSGISATWYSDNNSIATVVSGAYSNTCTVMGVAPGEAVITCQIMYQDVIYGYGDSAIVQKPVRDISIVRVVPADTSDSNTNNQQPNTGNTQHNPTMLVGDGGKASDFDRILDKDPADGESTFHDGLMPAVKNGKLGFINQNYKVVIPFIYESGRVVMYRYGNFMRPNQFYNGVARVQYYHDYIGDTTGGDDIVIDKTGKEIINLNDPSYSIRTITTNGKYILVVGQKRGTSYNFNPPSHLYDMTGKPVMVNSDYDSITAKYGEIKQIEPTPDEWNPYELQEEDIPQPQAVSALVGSFTLKARTSPSTNSAVAFTLKNGAKVTCYDKEGPWIEIITSDGRQAWVASAYLCQSPYTMDSGDLVTVFPASLKFRKEANTSSPVLYTLKNGAILRIIDNTTSKTWVKVMFNGVSGWVSASYIGKGI